MMKLKNIILVLITIVSLSSCFEYEDVDFKGIQDFSLADRTKENILIRLDLKVNNPNTYNITIKPTTLDVFINGKNAGKTAGQ